MDNPRARVDDLPAADHAHLVERLDPAVTTPDRVWTMRDDNHAHYHGVIKKSESPVVISLLWCADAQSRVHAIGVFRLHLEELLKAGFVRSEPAGGNGDEVRVRFHRQEGLVFLQVRSGTPALAVGHVEAGG